MSNINLDKLLLDNGFTYYLWAEEYVIENLRIYETEQCIRNIRVKQWTGSKFTIYINFKEGLMDIPNYGLNFDVSEYKMCKDLEVVWYGHIYENFTDKYELLSELHRFNNCGINIKG